VNHSDVVKHQVSDKRSAGLAFSPTQSLALERIEEAMRTSSLVIVEGGAGAGKTRLLRHIVEGRKGVLIDGRDVVRATSDGAHPCIEEQFHHMVEAALLRHDTVVVDDANYLFEMSRTPGYPRPLFMDVAARALMDLARKLDKCLVLAGRSFWVSPETHVAPELLHRAAEVDIGSPTRADLDFFLRVGLPAELLAQIDVDRLFQYAPGLNPYQIAQLCRLLRREGRGDERSVQRVLDDHILRTNVRHEEVADISFEDLKGFEEIVDKLTTFVINPLKFDQRFGDLGLKPKRGVLLYGPPGTGKTSVGRALARQMKGKFFLIDGSIPPEPAEKFFRQVKQVMDAAKSAAPSVVFIDDADVLFQSDRAVSLNRYLLTMLDGLESESAGKIAVIMTAMDPNHLPVPLLRSGRVELWLETKLPAESTRLEIVAAFLTGLPDRLANCDMEKIASMTVGFNAADMKRVVADVKALYARDVLRAKDTAHADRYFAEAADNVRRNKDVWKLAEAGKLDTVGWAEQAQDTRKRSRRLDEMASSGGE
jgi:transitional endoplasmic reticulum ATPase